MPQSPRVPLDVVDEVLAAVSRGLAPAQCVLCRHYVTQLGPNRFACLSACWLDAYMADAPTVPAPPPDPDEEDRLLRARQRIRRYPRRP